MASCVVQVSLLFKKVADINSKNILGCVRNASRGVGPTRNSRFKNYGFKKGDGEFVTRGQVLVYQPRLKVCPGLNTGCNSRFIYAKVDGRVVVTCDTTNFIEDHPIVVSNYPDKKVLWKKYVNVIPEPQHQRFKLVNTN